MKKAQMARFFYATYPAQTPSIKANGTAGKKNQPLHLHGAGAFSWTRELKMNTQKISPKKVLTTAEVCARYGFSRFTLSRKVTAHKFPRSTGRKKNGNVWDVNVLNSFDEEVNALAKKNWDKSLL